MRRRARNLKLKYKILIPIFMVLFLISLFNLYYYPHEQEKTITSEMALKITHITEMLGMAIGIGLDSGNYKSIETAFNWAKRHEDLSYIFVVSEDYEEIASFNPLGTKIDYQDFVLRKSAFLSSSNILNYTTPIKMEQENFGFIIVGLSFKSTDMRIASIRVRVLLLNLLIMFLIGGFVYFVVQLVTKNINKTTHLIEDMTANKSFYQKISMSSQDEMGILVQSFNSFVDALRNAQKIIEDDLAMASRIQKNIISYEYENYEDLDIYVKYQPQMEVGGDIYDINKLGDGKYRIFLADATGHGVQAALTTMLIKSEYDRLKNKELPVGEIMQKLNESFTTRYFNLTVFFTCIIMDIDLRHNQLTYSSAGHSNQIIMRGNRVLEELICGGKLVGIRKENNYIQNTIPWFAEDKLILFTDGLYEVFNDQGQELGESRLFLWMASHAGLKSKVYGPALWHDVEKFLGKADQFDDVTLLVIDRKDSDRSGR